MTKHLYIVISIIFKSISGLNLVSFPLLHYLGSYWRMLQAYRYPHEQLFQQWHKQDIRYDSVQLSFS